jgi:hypothetical protein
MPRIAWWLQMQWGDGRGIVGDILCMRMVKRGVTALITDGVMRDKLACWQPVCRSGVRRGGTGFGQSADIRRLE